MPPRNRHKSPPETIRMILAMQFPCIYTNEQELAATGIPRTVGPPLSPSPQISTSKRSMAMVLSLSSDAESDQQSYLPFYRELIAWQSPMPGHYVLHLADNLDVQYVKSIGNLDALLAAYILPYVGLDFQIPSRHKHFSATKRQDASDIWGVGGRRAETVTHLIEAHSYRERLAAACASVLVGNAAVELKNLTMSGRIADFDNARAVAWTNTPRTLLPGCDEARAAGYHTIDSALPGVAASIRAKLNLQNAVDAIDRFHLADAAVTEIQPICAPLNPNFPLDSMVQIAREEIDLASFKCHGPSDPEHPFCHSERCICGPDGSERLTVSGRPTGVDGEPALSLISNAATKLPRGSISDPAWKTGSLLIQTAWSKAEASDSTFITISGHNRYVLGIRDRANQTLYLSDPQDIDRDPMKHPPAYLPAQIGYAMLAFHDACSRGLQMEDRRRKGTLPHRFRQRLDSEIDPLESDLPFEKLKLFYERDVGVFLPPALSNPEYTFDFNSSMFLHAAEVLVHWDADDAAALQYMVGKSQSPLRLGVVELDAVVEVDRDPDAPQMYSSWYPGYTLDVKIHCWKQHGERVFLCHLINDHDDKTPFGRPIIMKACRSRHTSEVDEPSAVLRAIEAGRDTQDLEHEVDVLKRLERNDTLSSRVPRVYRFFSHPIRKDISDFKFSAYFMEDCEGYYPLGIADAVSPTLRDNLFAWLDTLHKNHFVHRNLSCENILFNPSKPDSFYVTGWGRSLSMSDGTEISNWDEYVAHDIESLRTLFIRQEPNSVPPKKRARYNDDGVDGESMQEDDYLYAQDVEDWDELRNFLSQSPSPSGRWVAEHIAEQAAPMHTWWST